MKYTLIISKAVQKQLDSLPDDICTCILEEISLLAENPWPPGTVKLKGYKNEYRIRSGDYRVRYAIDDKEFVVVLLHCKHRKDIYRK